MGCERLQTAARAVHSRFQETWNFDGRDFSKPSSDEVLRQLVSDTPADCRERLEKEFFDCGPIAPLLERQDLQEIIVNGPRDIWFEAGGRFEKLPDGFLTESTFRGFIDRLTTEAGLKVDLAQPFADGRWREFRVHLGRAPLTDCEYHLTLRRVGNQKWNLPTLRERGWCGDRELEVLKNLISSRVNLLMIGPTGCGKTTVLSAMLAELPERERVVILEDTDELARPNSASTKMLTRAFSAGALPEVGLTELVRQSLRMRPQRLVMGEVRGPEAKDLLLALATGHGGSLGTLHAENPRQALLRLEMLVQLGAPQWSAQTVRQLMQFSVGALVVCGNENGHRRLLGIHKVAALESFGFLLEPLL
ncbi:MAG TPA: ATPase, T2SS/T4P/T4SS family [Bdellovibrionales bacterium]|nr:ATPase, T2SS/T4P/T4SS family [Bdellovibrionales bacterium]